MTFYMPQFLTVEQVAQELQVNTDTVRQWLRGGRLKGVKVGRAWRIPARELIALGMPESTVEHLDETPSQPTPRTSS
jgi:excisionase family DNA binding protein